MSHKRLFYSLLLLVGAGIFYSSKADAATLNASPTTNTVTAGQTFNVTVLLNTQGQAVDGVDLYFVKYNPSILEVVDSNATQTGIQIQPGSLLGITVVNSADNSLGKIQFSQASTGGSNYNGSGTLATITFKGKANGTSTITFDYAAGSTTDSNVAAGGADVLSSVTNSQATVSGGSDPTPQPLPPPPPPPTQNFNITWDMYPSGTIFKYANSATVYIKEGTVGRPITSWSVYQNQVPGSRSITTIPSTVTFTQGSILGLRSGTLIKASNDATVYLIVGSKKQGFPTAQEFYDRNYNFSNVYVIDDINLVNSIEVTTQAFVRPFGTLFKYASSPAVYFLNSSRLKRGYTSIAMFNIWNATLKDVITIPDSEQYADGPLADLPGGILVKGSTTTVYFVFDGVLRPISTELLTAMGMTTAMIKTFPDSDISRFQIGSAM